jgi:hypothetical protein
MRAATALLALLMFLPQDRAAEHAKPEETGQLVGMVDLLANPERFNEKRVTVVAYLVIGNRGVNANSSLCLHREDSENVLVGNCLMVVPSQSMHRNWQELTNMYVRITGTIVTGDRGPPLGRFIAIQDVRACEVWSDPRRPRALNLQSYFLKDSREGPAK